MACELVARGHQVTIVCGAYAGADTGITGPYTKGARRGIVDNIDVVEFDLPYSNSQSFAHRGLIFLKFARRSISLALREKYDVLFATSTPLTAGIPGIAASLLRRKPFVFEVRDLWPDLPRAMGVIRNPMVLWMMRALEWCTYHSARACIGLSPGMVEGIIKRGISPNQVSMVPNGCDLAIFGRECKATWRPGEVAPDDLMAVFAGTHGVANGLSAIVDVAIELNRRERSDIKLLLVGDGKLKPALVERSRTEGLSNIVFLPPIPKNALADLMSSTDVGLMVLSNVPAFYCGTSPNKFFDYLAAGIPVLNNYPGWIAGIIESNGCGIVVPPDNAVAFADALECLAADRASAKAMGVRARAVAEREFDRRFLAAKFVEILEAVWLEEGSRVVSAQRAANIKNRRKRRAAKRAFDCLIAGLILAVTSPLLLVLATAVVVKLGRPVIFVQRRPGLNERIFSFYKFRSMTDKRDARGNLIPDDERLTTFGKWLRAASLDELPQLFNVLKGDMSIVGPRPLLEEYLPLYSLDQSRRHEIKPGITGWAQVNGRNSLSWEEKFELDAWYVDHQSFLLDLKIIWMTLVKVWRSEGINQPGQATMERFGGKNTSRTGPE